MRAVPVLRIACIGLALVAGCRVYDPELLARDASVDTGPVTLLHAPPRPNESTEGPDVDPVAFGMRNAFLDQGAAWETTGLDVDGYYTASGRLVGECDPGGPSLAR